MKHAHFTPSSKSLSFVVKAFEAHTGTEANTEIQEKLLATMRIGLFRLLATISDSLLHNKEHLSSSTDGYAITKQGGGFTETIISALALRMHCLKEDYPAFGDVFGTDLRLFLKEHGDAFAVHHHTHLRLHDDGIVYVRASAGEHVHAHSER
jgi:hypothetical protein